MSNSGKYDFLSVTLLESEFWRNNFLPDEIIGEVNLNHTHHLVNDTELYCFFELGYFSGSDESEFVKAHIKMVGHFQIIGTPPLSVEKFTEVNSQAIMFPFIREHLASLTLKAGMDPILLPPVNFVEKATLEKRKESD
ncbi:MAG: protein-export chaperone SecB [Bacteroidia bacterium]|jgi:preprotein translocase subunit SecB|nr:protein-export chaperone SecB [Bacteroidia bacterium]